MSQIELYFGSKREQMRSEQVVLKRVIEILVSQNASAVIFSNIWLGNDQVDILVGTESVTLQLEVKGFRRKIVGAQNGDWYVTTADGRTEKRNNGYLQALANNQALRNHMAGVVGSPYAVSYPNGAVLFQPGIPDGSEFDIPPDKRVVLCGIEELENLLTSPSPKPWPLDWLRTFAMAKRLTAADPFNPFSARTQRTAQRPTEPPPQPATISYDVSTATAPIKQPMPTLTPVLVPAPTLAIRSAHTVVVGPSAVWPKSLPIDVPPKRKRSMARLFTIVLAITGAGALWAHYFHDRTPQQTTTPSPRPVASSSPPVPKERKVTHHTPSRHTHQTRKIVESSTAPRTLPILVGGQPSETPFNVLDCPPGVDRLGCNGRVGQDLAPECPTGFQVSGATCVRTETTVGQ